MPLTKRSVKFRIHNTITISNIIFKSTNNYQIYSYNFSSKFRDVPEKLHIQLWPDIHGDSKFKRHPNTRSLIILIKKGLIGYSLMNFHHTDAITPSFDVERRRRFQRESKTALRQSRLVMWYIKALTEFAWVLENNPSTTIRLMAKS